MHVMRAASLPDRQQVSLATAATASSTDSLSKLKLTERIHASTAATSQAAGVPGISLPPRG